MEVVRGIRHRIGQHVLERHFETLRTSLATYSDSDKRIAFSVFTQHVALLDCSEDDQWRLFELGVSNDDLPLLRSGANRCRGNVFSPSKFLQRLHSLVYSGSHPKTPSKLAPPRVLETAKQFLVDAFAADENGLLRVDEFHSLCSKYGISLSHGSYSHGLMQHINFDKNVVDVRPLEEFVMSHTVNEADLPPEGPLEKLEDRFKELADRHISKAEFANAIPGVRPDVLPDRFNFNTVRELVVPASMSKHASSISFEDVRHPPARQTVRPQSELRHRGTDLITHKNQTDKDVAPEDDPWMCYPLQQKQDAAGVTHDELLRDRPSRRQVGSPDPAAARASQKRLISGPPHLDAENDEASKPFFLKKRLDAPVVPSYKVPFGTDAECNESSFRRRNDYGWTPVPPNDAPAGVRTESASEVPRGTRTFYGNELPYQSGDVEKNAKGRGTARKEDQDNILVWEQQRETEQNHYRGSDAPFGINYAGEARDVSNPFGKDRNLAYRPPDHMQDVLQGEQARLHHLRARSAADLHGNARENHDAFSTNGSRCGSRQGDANISNERRDMGDTSYRRGSDAPFGVNYPGESRDVSNPFGKDRNISYRPQDHMQDVLQGEQTRIQQLRASKGANHDEGFLARREDERRYDNYGPMSVQQNMRPPNQDRNYGGGFAQNGSRGGSQGETNSNYSQTRSAHSRHSGHPATTRNPISHSQGSPRSYATPSSRSASHGQSQCAPVRPLESIARWPDMFGNRLPAVWKSLVTNKSLYFQDSDMLSKDQIQTLFRVTRVPVAHGKELFDSLARGRSHGIDWNEFVDALYSQLLLYRCDILSPRQIQQASRSTDSPQDSPRKTYFQQAPGDEQERIPSWKRESDERLWQKPDDTERGDLHVPQHVHSYHAEPVAVKSSLGKAGNFHTHEAAAGEQKGFALVDNRQAAGRSNRNRRFDGLAPWDATGSLGAVLSR